MNIIMTIQYKVDLENTGNINEILELMNENGYGKIIDIEKEPKKK